MSRLEEKKLVVEELKKVADEALSAVVVDYRGTNVPDLTLLRKDASSSSVYLRVIKNTLAKRALEGTKFDSINEILTGPSLFAFSLDDFKSAAKLVKDFSKSHESFSVKGLSVGEGLLDASELDRLASLPSKGRSNFYVNERTSKSNSEICRRSTESTYKLCKNFGCGKKKLNLNFKP